MSDPYAVSAKSAPSENAPFKADFIAANLQKHQSAYDDRQDQEFISLTPSNTSRQSITNDPSIMKSGDDLMNELMDDDEGFGHSTYGQRMDYETSSYQDKAFAILFIAHLILFVVIFIIQWSTIKPSFKEINAGFLIVFVCACVGTCLGFLWTKVIRSYSGRIIKTMLYGNLLCLSLACLLNFFMLNLLNVLIFGFLTLIFAFYMWTVWKRIPFTECLIEMACAIINTYESVIVVALGILVLQIVWILWWSAVTVFYISYTDGRLKQKHGDSTGQTPPQWNGFVIFCLLVSFYWNLETLKNIGHTTFCGVAATWFFSNYPHSPTAGAFKRAVTTSLGSIALGSLIVAFISAVRYVVNQMRRKSKHGVVICLLDCMLHCLQRMIEYFNMYAFAHCAIYGTGYVESAKNAWQLLRLKGIDALINDDLTGFAILCGALIGGIICAAIGGVMGHIGTDAAHTYAFLGFLVGFYLCLTVLQVVTSCVLTIFVCYAEDPHTMSVNHPMFFKKLDNAKSRLGHVNIGEEDDHL